MSKCAPRHPLTAACLAAFTLCAALGAATPGYQSPDGAWTFIREAELSSKRIPNSTAWIRPDKFAAVEVDPLQMEAILLSAPMEYTHAARIAPAILTVPRPDGTFEAFEIWESPMMEPELFEWMSSEGYPMRTYAGRSLENHASIIRLDYFGPQGFHASVLAPGDNEYYIDPYWQGDDVLYSSYFRRELSLDGSTRPDATCGLESLRGTPDWLDPVPTMTWKEIEEWEAQEEQQRGGTVLRTFRLAVAATGEYTATVGGGTAVGGQAAVVTAINRVNQVYMNDLRVRLNLVGTNQNVIYTNAGTDPFNNNNDGAMLTQTQNTMTSVIGAANYDIGHSFGTGGGGVAILGSICNPSFKAMGTTGLPFPSGDAFWIDFVSHEMGHQFGGNHTFNTSDNSTGCASQRNASTAYENGSGISIQAYAGVCSPAENIANFSIPYFHAGSIMEIFTTIASVGACPGSTPINNNNAPTINAGSNYTVPRNTPLLFTPISAADADGNPITVSWESMHTNPSGALLASGDNGTAPLWRVFSPTTFTGRYIPPQINVLTASANPKGIISLNTSRTITMRALIRDNNAEGGRVGTSNMTVTSNTSGPFTVTAPTNGQSFTGGNNINVTWNVNSTNALTGGATVDILFAVDGGTTWPHVLASGTPNDGSESVTLPNVSAAGTGKIMVRSSGNIFYNVSPGFFTVTMSAGAPPAPSGLALAAASDSGASNSDRITNDTTPTITGNAQASSTVALTSSISGAMGSGTATGGGTFSVTGSTIAQGNHNITATATNGSGTSPASSALAITVDTAGPTVSSSNPSNAGVAGAITEITINYNENLWAATATNAANYQLVGTTEGPVAVIPTITGSNPTVVRLCRDAGCTLPFAYDDYTLTLVATAGIRDVAGNNLNNGTNGTITFSLQFEANAVTWEAYE